MTATRIEQPSITYLEQLLNQAAIDADFRSELLENPEAFGLASDPDLAILASVEQQDESVFEFLDDSLGELNIVPCRSTCNGGPFTIVCDGTTK